MVTPEIPNNSVGHRVARVWAHHIAGSIEAFEKYCKGIANQVLVYIIVNA